MFSKSILTFRELINNSRNLINPNRYLQITAFNNIKSRSLEEKLGFPPKPKRPLTPYIRYMKQIRPKIAAENPNANIIELVKIIADKWHKIDDNTKIKLEDEFRKEQMAYIENRAKYDNQLTDEQKNDLKKLKRHEIEMKERRLLRKRAIELGKPKKPLSAFLKFLANERVITPIPQNMAYKDWIRKATEKWVRLPEKEKEKFKIESKKEHEKYKQELSKWESKMVRLGNLDVIRQESVIDKEHQPQQTKKKLA